MRPRVTLFAGVLCLGAGLAAGGAPASKPATRPLPSALADKYIKQYVAVDWETLDADLAAHAKEFSTALSKEQLADIAYVRAALAECRPPWWNDVKQNKKQPFHATLWGRPMNLTFDPALQVGGINFSATNGVLALSVCLPAADMDSPTKAEHGFTKGELANVGVWQVLEVAAIYASMVPSKIVALDADQRLRLERFQLFRGTISAAYYGTPRSRRWAAWLSMDAFSDRTATAANFIPRKPVGAMLMAEIVGHPWRYPSFKLPAAAPAGNAEKSLAASLLTQFERTTLTFAEDRALRDALKDFAGTSGMAVFNTGKVMLPNKLFMTLEPAQDGADLAARNAWLANQLAHPSTAPTTRGK